LLWSLVVWQYAAGMAMMDSSIVAIIMLVKWLIFMVSTWFSKGDYTFICFMDTQYSIHEEEQNNKTTQIQMTKT